MSELWRQFEEQMRAARGERSPEVHVTAAVTRRIAAGQVTRVEPVDWARVLFGSATVATAAAVLIAAFVMWQGVNDPLAGLLSPIDLVMR